MSTIQQWYYFKNGHHYGPFSGQQIKTFYFRGELKAFHLLWGPGLKKWIPFEQLEKNILEPKNVTAKVYHLNNSIDKKTDVKAKVSRPLPQYLDIKMKIDEGRTKAFLFYYHLKSMRFYISRIYYDLTDSIIRINQKRSNVMSEFVRNLVNIRLIDFTRNLKKKIGNVQISSKYLLTTLVVIICALIYWSTLHKVVNKTNIGKRDAYFPSKLSEMTQEQYQRLKRIGMTPYAGQAEFQVEMAPDRSQIWISSNYHKKSKVIIVFNSIADRVLSETPVRFQVEGLYEGPLTSFNKLKLLDGQDVPEGEYEVELNLIPEGPIKNSKKDKTYSTYGGGVNVKKNIKINPILAYYKKSKNQFNDDLVAYQNIKYQKLLRPLVEQQQKYKTILILVDQIFNLFKTELTKIYLGKEVQNFSQKYAQQYGGILRDLGMGDIEVIETGRRRKRVTDDGDFLKITRKIGSIIISTIKSVEKMKIVNKYEKLIVAKQLKNNLGHVKKMIKDKLVPLQERIGNLETKVKRQGV